MPMPKAAVYEDNLPVARKQNVWAAWEILPVKAKPISNLVQKVPYHLLRRGIPTDYARHYPASLFRCAPINHSTTTEYFQFKERSLSNKLFSVSLYQKWGRIYHVILCALPFTMMHLVFLGQEADGG